MTISLQITMDDCCGDENEEKNPYPANDYIGNRLMKGCINVKMRTCQ